MLLAASGRARARDYFVNPSGAGGAYPTVQSAVDAVAGQTETTRANIFLAPARYVERVIVDKPFVTFIGQGVGPADVNISFNRTPVSFPEFSFGATVTIRSTAVAFMARNLTFENSIPDRNAAPGVALESDADRAIFDNVRLLGYQDTLLVYGMTRQYFRDSLVTGDGDFIFGNATAVFDRCRIESTDGGYITAANTARTTANGLIFLDCSLVKGSDRNPFLDDGTSAPDESVFLGRPWLLVDPEVMPSVIYIRARMGTHIIRAGWDPWASGINPSIDRDPLTRVSEWGSMNLAGQLLTDSNQDGTPDGRVSWADRMTAAQAANYTLQNIFGPVEFWNASTQPETPGIVYTSQGEPWDLERQLLALPDEPARSQMLNIATRLHIDHGDSAGIGGFVIEGTEPKKVALRGIGPSLGGPGSSAVLTDPTLELHQGSVTLATNDDWKMRPDGSSQQAEVEATGLSPSDDFESVIVAILNPGTYTAILAGKDGMSGLGVVEIYDLAEGANSKLANISSRGFVDTGDNVMIGGFIVGGGLGDGSATVIVRAIAPSLNSVGVSGALQDPTLALHDGNGVLLVFNDNWKLGSDGVSQQAKIAATNLAPTNDLESAILSSLAPGNYTAIVRGVGNTTGIGVVEVYNLQ
jgi:pectin methylesterase-like acyl-CoA thioesterase